MAYTPAQRQNALAEVDRILGVYIEQNEIYQQGYLAAMDGINDNPFDPAADPDGYSDWVNGHLDGVIVQRYIEGEFDE